MRKVLKWIGIVLGGLVLLLVIAGISLYLVARGRLNRDYDIQVEAITIPTDEASVERGRHLVEAVSGCGGCHGDGLAGAVFIDDPAIGTFYASNLTSGEGGVGARFSDTDWVRAIRHGVRPDGTPLLIMPSNLYYRYSDEDLGAIIAYLKSLPPVGNQTPARQFAIPAHFLLALGVFGPDAFPAEVIDHEGPHPEPPELAVTEAYGEHLTYVAGCRGCHATELAGGQGAPGEPMAPNLTPGGELANWSEEDFFILMRSGTTPEGQQVNPFMPWMDFQNMTDEEIQAIWLYLQSIPARESFTP